MGKCFTTPPNVVATWGNALPFLQTSLQHGEMLYHSSKRRCNMGKCFTTPPNVVATWGNALPFLQTSLQHGEMLYHSSKRRCNMGKCFTTPPNVVATWGNALPFLQTSLQHGEMLYHSSKRRCNMGKCFTRDGIKRVVGRRSAERKQGRSQLSSLRTTNARALICPYLLGVCTNVVVSCSMVIV